MSEARRQRRAPGAEKGAASPSLAVRFRRVSPTHHRLELLRADGTGESFEVETKSVLVHDLVHFAVETEAGLTSAFYGRIARGTAYADLAHPEIVASADNAELLATESIVGPLQGAVAGGLQPGGAAAFVDGLRRYFASIGESLPPWLTADLVVRVLERLRRLQGHWRATPFGEALELRFEPRAPDAADAPGKNER